MATTDLAVGKKIRITKGQSPCFWDGDIAVLQSFDVCWLANFNDQGNPRIAHDGLWFVDPDDFELI